MNDTEAFLRKIRENPDDDAPRLVFADYLDEQSQNATGKEAKERASWAALIRAGVAKERESFADVSLWNKWAGVDNSTFVCTPAYDLVPKDCRDGLGWWASRGFYDEIFLELPEFVMESDSLFESLAPIRKIELDLFDEDWDWRVLEGDPLLGLIRNLDLSSNYAMSEENFEGIFNDSQLQTLTILDVQTFGIYDFDFLPILKDCQEFPSLRSLTGSFDSLKEYRELLQYPLTSKLEILAGDNSTVECGTIYSRAPLAKTLTWLELDEDDDYEHKKWKWGHFPNLKRIGIQMIGEKDWVTPFLESQDLKHLESLELRGKTMIPSVLKSLEFGEGEFSLSLDGMSRPTLKGILGSPTMRRVKSLILEGKSMEYALEILSKNEVATNLRSLKINPTDGIKKPIPFYNILCTSPVFANLLHLEISMQINLTALKQIGESLLGQSLRALSCSSPRLREKWQDYLRKSNNLPNLVHLSFYATDLDENKLAKGRKKLKLT